MLQPTSQVQHFFQFVVLKAVHVAELGPERSNQRNASSRIAAVSCTSTRTHPLVRRGKCEALGGLQNQWADHEVISLHLECQSGTRGSNGVNGVLPLAEILRQRPWYTLLFLLGLPWTRQS